MRASKEIVVIGASAGGIHAIQEVIKDLDKSFPCPIIVVEHHRGGGTSDLASLFDRHSKLTCKEAESGEVARPGTMYIAPGDYHLLIESDGSLSLSVDEKVNWSRPSIDVLFESAAESFGAKVIAVLLTGANNDGARGVEKLIGCGAEVFVQDPSEAEFATMPQSAIDLCELKESYRLSDINQNLLEIQKVSHGR